MLQLACAIEKATFSDQRRARRYPALRYASIRSSRQDAQIPGSIVDLSTSGCRIATKGSFLNGTRVCLRMLDMQAWWGTVVWEADGEIGVAFEHPLHPAVVEHIARTTPR